MTSRTTLCMVLTLLAYHSQSNAAAPVTNQPVNTPPNSTGTAQATSKSDQTILRQAVAATQSGNYPQAINLYRQYLITNPNDKSAFISLIRVELISGNYVQSAQLLKNYVSKFGKDDAFLTQIARYLALTGQPESALKITRPLLNKYPENPELLDIEGYASQSYNLQQTKKSQEQTATTSTVEDDNLIQANLAVQQKNYAKAISLYHEYLKKDPGNKDVYLSIIRLNSIQGNYHEASKTLNIYQTKFGADDNYLKEKARFLALTDQAATAIPIINSLMERNPLDTELPIIRNYALARVPKPQLALPQPNVQVQADPHLVSAQNAINQGNFRQAASFYKQYLAQYPNDKEITILATRLLLKTGQYSQALSMLSTYKQRFSEDVPYQIELARYYALTGHTQAALSIVNPLLQNNSTDPTLLDIQQYALKQQGVTPGQTATASPNQLSGSWIAPIVPSPTVVSSSTVRPSPTVTKPTATNPMLLAAQTALAKKDSRKAMGLYQQYLQQNPNDKEATILLIQLYLQAGDYNAASNLLSKYKNNFGEDRAYLTEQARCYALNNKSQEALAILTPLLKKYPDDKTLLDIRQYALTHTQTLPTVAQQQTQPKNAMLLAAEEALAKKDTKRAVLLYQDYLKHNPNDKETTILLVQLLLQSSNFDAGLNLLTQYKNNFGEDKAYLTEQARYYALNNKSQEALAILEPLLKESPNDKTLLDIKQYALTHKGSAIASGQQAAPTNPTLVAAQLAIAKKDFKKAIGLYRNYLAKNPGDKEATILLIQLLSQESKFDDSLKMLAQYKKQFGEDTSYWTEQARYFALNNKSKEALAIVGPLLKKDPTNKLLLEIKQYALTHKGTISTTVTDEIDAPSYSYAALASLEQCDIINAFRLIQKALEKDPENKQYQNLRKEIVARFINKPFCHDKLDPKFVLELARTLTESGCLDIPADLYYIYTTKWPWDKKPWLEWAYVEAWKGDSRKSNNILNNYYCRFGATSDYLTVRAYVLAGANKPNAALAITEPLLATKRTDYDYNYARVTALYYGNRPNEMICNLDVLNALKPGDKQTWGMNDFAITPFRDRITLDAYHSFDADTVRISWSMATGQYFITPKASLLADYKLEQIRADLFSGLAPVTGGESLMIDRARGGFTYRFDPYIWFRGLGGAAMATKGGGTKFIYSADLETRMHDKLAINFLSRKDFYDVSPKAVSLGITQTLNQMFITWEPVIQTYFTARAFYANYSDRNNERFLEFNPKTYVLANELINVVLGADAMWYSFAHNSNNGYYSPTTYHFYAANSYFTFKQSDNINYVFTCSIGRQKDETFKHYATANDYSAQAYIGIYEPWYLILTANQSSRGRPIAANSNQGKYYVYSFFISLTRRF